MPMVLSSSMLSSIHIINISDNSSIGSFPDGPCPNRDAGVKDEAYWRLYNDASMDVGVDLSYGCQDQMIAWLTIEGKNLWMTQSNVGPIAEFLVKSEGQDRLFGS